MATRKFIFEDPGKPRKSSEKAATRDRIEDALLALLAEGEAPNHDAVAARAGLSRRTVYRYFPDQEALRAAAFRRLSPAGSMPETLDQLLGRLPYVFRAFDRNHAAMMVTMSSAEGRAIRNQQTSERVAAYRAVLAPATAALPEPDRTQVAALVQLLTSGLAWRDMRDQWGMEAPEMATAVRWAIDVLLADLARRGDAGLERGPAPQA